MVWNGEKLNQSNFLIGHVSTIPMQFQQLLSIYHSTKDSLFHNLMVEIYNNKTVAVNALKLLPIFFYFNHIYNSAVARVCISFHI